MKILSLRKATASVLAAAGVLWGANSAIAQLNHAVGDPSFEEINLGALDYYYFQGPPNSPFWKKHALSIGRNAVYNTSYATDNIPFAPDPHTGNQAIDGEGAYNYQVLSDVFVAGRKYTYTAHIQGWGEVNTSDANDRFWMYLFAGAGENGDFAPGDGGVSGNMDNNSILRATWHQVGTIDGILKTGAGAHSFLPFSGFNRDSESAWTQVGLSYTATGADAGKRIGLGFWANEFGAVDDIALTSTGSTLGDYDGNGSVGPEDYAMWRSMFGLTVAAGSGADGNGNGIVDAADYAIWRDNSPSGSGSGSVVPEPATDLMCMLATGIVCVAVFRYRNGSTWIHQAARLGGQSSC